MSCDCAQPEKQHHSKEKCIHLREAEERAKAAGYHDDQQVEKDAAHLARVAEEQGCCCLHGGKCTCALLMKEHNDAASTLHGPAVKPKLEKTTSDGAITVFTNGHHKPVHRKNHAAHECGMPYKIPMPRHDTEQNISASARRSVDSLALDTNKQYQPSDFTPQTSAPFNTERRKSKSEQPSPKMQSLSGSCNGLGDAKLQSIDFSNLSQTQTNQSMQSATSDSFSFMSLDPMSGAVDSAFDPWSAYPSADSAAMPNNNPFGVWPSSTDNMNVAQPALTVASSGTTSEIDEMPPMEEVYDFPMPSIQEDSGFNLANMSTGNSPQFNRRSLPPGFFGNTDFGMTGVGNDWPTPTAGFNNFVAENKSSVPPSSQSASFDESWPMTSGRQITSVPQRAIGGMQTSRPQSRSVGSVGPGSAPNDDLIKQLFPELDINGSMFGPSNSPEMNMTVSKGMNSMPTSNPTSAPIDFGGPMDTSSSYATTTQPWSDGSLSIPNDDLPTSYDDLDEDFPNPNFNANWSQ